MIIRFPPGMRADGASEFSLQGLMSNTNAYAEEWVAVPSASPNVDLTAAQVLAKNLIFTAGAGASFTVTLPPTVRMVDALGPTIPRDGSYWFPFCIANQLSGQDLLLVARDIDTTVDITNNTVPAGFVNRWMVNALAPRSITEPIRLFFYSVFTMNSGVAPTPFVLTVTDGVTTVSPVDKIKFIASSPTVTDAGGGEADVTLPSPGTMVQAEYVTLALDAGLTSERVLTAGANISITDNGPNGTVVIAASGGGAGSLVWALILGK